MTPVTAQSEEIALKVGVSFGIRYGDIQVDQSSLPGFDISVSWSALLKEVFNNGLRGGF